MKLLCLLSFFTFYTSSLACDKPLKITVKDVEKNYMYSMLGFKNNDIILKINNETYCSPKDFQTKTQKGIMNKKLQFLILRDKKEQKLDF